MALLETLTEYESKLDTKMVGDIWTNLVSEYHLDDFSSIQDSNYNI